ncbi:hypothetical protein Ancab_003360 [Ancistrocladus abbreviatus]
MGSTFNPQILMEKLAKLNNSQQSIETLSHWCIFHMNKANKLLRHGRDSFIVLPNSRRKGAEFVGEFWRVLPDALRDVIQNGDDFGRNAALRLINIWDDRKVFGSRGHILKEEFVGRQSDNSSKNDRQFGIKLRPPGANTVDKIVSGYEVIYGGQLDEDVILSRCRNAVNCVQKVEKDIGGDTNSGEFSGIVEELQGQHAVLRECIQQLTAIEASRATLVSNLREALREQEFKLDQVHNQLQAAELQSELAVNICRQLLNSGNVQLLDEQGLQEPRTTAASQGFVLGDREQSAPVIYTRQLPFLEKSGAMEEDPRKSAAAAVAAQLSASTSSAQMLTYVLSSLAQEGVIGSTVKDTPIDYPSEKRAKLDGDQSSYVPPSSQQPPLPPFPHPDALQHNATTKNEAANEQPPPPPSSPPPMPPLPPMPPYPMPQFMQTAGPLSGVPYSFGATQQPAPPLASYPPVAPVSGISPYAPPPANAYQTFQASESGFYGQQPSLPMAPISRQ